MRAIVVLNGESVEFPFEKGDRIISCDGALSYLKSRNITPDVTLGDFDSLGYVPENALVYPIEKDKTDGEIAVEYAISQGYKEVVLICAGGLREDHFLGNLALLKILHDKGVSARMETRNSVIYFFTDDIRVNVSLGATVSLVAVSPMKVLRSEGLKYAYNNTFLDTSSTLGISNEAISDEIGVFADCGAAYLIVNK